MNIRILIASLLGLVLFSACTKDEKTNPTPQPIDKVELGTATTASGLTVTLWSNLKDLKTGFNLLFVSLKNTDKASVTDKIITFLPMMDMGSMKHSSPVQQPKYNAETSLYEGAVVFTMPSGEMGSWDIELRVNDEVVKFDLTILASDLKVTGSYSGTDGEKYFVTLMPHEPWKVGLNDFSILINQSEDMNSFPPYNDFSIDFDPEMSSMGHGSPNNLAPVSMGEGIYKGKVNYTMTGDWKLNFKLKRGNEVIVENAFVEVLF